MLLERLAGAMLFTAGFTAFLTRASRRKAQRIRPAFAHDVVAVITIVVLFLGLIMLTGMQVLDFSTTNPAP